MALILVAFAPTICLRVTDESRAGSAVILGVSPRTGVLDIHDGSTGQLVQNLVVVLAWTDAAGEHYNNAEIQGRPISVGLDPQGRPSSLTYAMLADEALPVRQPASMVTVELHVDYQEDGGLKLVAAVAENPLGLEGLRIGVGAFYGVHHGTWRARVGAGPGWAIEAFGEAGGAVGRMGSWSRYRADRVTLDSVYPDMPALRIETGCPDARVDLEQRSAPWAAGQEAEAARYREASGRATWIEAAIVYAGCASAPFAVSLEARPRE